jgi:2'-5' RNA ligase
VNGVAQRAEINRRLFFALWPDADTRHRLATLARHWNQQPVPANNLHMTLVFLGSCSAIQQQCVAAAAGEIRQPAFPLSLDYLGGWSQTRTQWLGTSNEPDALINLLTSLQAAVTPCGFAADPRRFVPHVTLSRRENAPPARTGLDPICWPVREFVLAESLPGQDGARYLVRARWPLG